MRGCCAISSGVADEHHPERLPSSKRDKIEARQRFRTKKTAAPTMVAQGTRSDWLHRRSISADTRTTTCRRRRETPSLRGWPACRTKGSLPRSSRTSVVPIAATQPAAAGPPRPSRPMIGAIATACWVPREARTGRRRCKQRQHGPEHHAQRGFRVAWLGAERPGRAAKSSAMRGSTETQKSQPRVQKRSEPRLRRCRASGTSASLPRTLVHYPRLYPLRFDRVIDQRTRSPSAKLPRRVRSWPRCRERPMTRRILAFID